MSVILVGNGESLLGSNMGEKIDSYDTVVRFDGLNIEGYEKDVGTKTDILVLDSYNFLRYMKTEFDDIRDEMYDLCEIWVTENEESYNLIVESFKTDFKNLKYWGHEIKDYKESLGYYSYINTNRVGCNYISPEFFSILNFIKRGQEIDVVGFDFLKSEINNLKHEVVYGENELLDGLNSGVNGGYYLAPCQKFKKYYSNLYWGVEGAFSYNLEIKTMRLLENLKLFIRRD
jgi:hypothetical protein